MGFFGKLIKAAADTVVAPVDIIKDVVTMGGALTDQDKPYTAQRIEKIVKDVEGAGEDAGNGDFI